MDRIYKLFTGDYVDLGNIISIGKMQILNKSGQWNVDMKLYLKIFIKMQLCNSDLIIQEDINEEYAHYEHWIDEDGYDNTEMPKITNVGKKYYEEKYNEFINAWERYVNDEIQ